MNIMVWGYRNLGFGWLRIAPALSCAALAWFSSGCGSMPVGGEESPGLESQAIEWGVVDGARPAVGKLMDSRGYCTATLLPHSTNGSNNSSDIVLGAAHCSDQLATQYFYVDDGSGAGLTRYRVDAMAMKPYRDLMIMHLATPVPISSSAPTSPASTYSINTGSLPTIGTTCTAVGYGRHDQNDGTSGARHAADVSVSQYSGTAEGADTRIYTRGITGQAASGDSGGPLLCNGKIAGVLSSGPDWEFAKTAQVSYSAVDVDWIQRYMALAPPSVTYSLYMIEAGTLWRADSSLGNRERVTDFGALANPTGVAALGGQLYALLDGWLVRIDPVSGAQTTLGTQIWSGGSQLVSLQDSLYAIQNGALWRVTSLTTGARQRVGTWDWTGATGMTGIVRDDGLALLWIVSSNRVWWLDPATQASGHSAPNWDGVTSIANVNGTPYLVHANALWKVDNRFPVTLSVAEDGNDWTDATSLASLDRHVYAIQNKWLVSYYLHTGVFQKFNHWGWSASTLMTALP